ncbi:MAG TPA: hypothetical protein VGJ96_03740 [Gemmatimonadaceae bacterium]|jgi:hypothetical protein
MAERKVYVHLKQTGESGENRIEITVHPWTIRSHTGDTITWVKMNAQIEHAAPRRSRKKVRWPFAKRRVVAGIKNALYSLRRLPVKRKGEKQYILDITFRDHAGRRRTASIDPDMVIET